MRLLIKIGGTLLENDAARQALAEQIAALSEAGHRTVVVHGGGKRLSRYLQEQNYQSEFRRGLRVTPPEILDAVLRIFAGSVNHNLVAELQKAGAKAVGLSGIDSGLVHAVQLHPELGAVGKVDRVNAELLNLLTENGYVPTVACIAGSESGEIFNVNADQMAAACAVGFRADKAIFLTDVGGVLDAEQNLLARLTVAGCRKLIDDGVAQGGMEAKLTAATAAVEDGIGEVRIIAGAEPDALKRLLEGDSLGTTIVAD